MDNPKFDNYIHALNILSRSKVHIEQINKFKADELDIRHNLDTLRKNLNGALLQYDADLLHKKDKQNVQEDLDTCVDKLNFIAESGLDKQKHRRVESDDLKAKLNILDEAFLLKHFTGSTLVEEDAHLTGVLLNKVTCKADTIKIPLDNGSSKTPGLIEHLQMLYNMTPE